MNTIYLLPCTCGKSIEVDRSQAGLTVHCACGRGQEVPTIRGLALLESRVRSQVAPRLTWGPAQGVIFAGLALAAIAGTTALYRQVFPPRNPVEGVNRERLAELFGNMTPDKSLELWGYLSQGIDRTELPQILYFREVLARHQRWTRVAWGVAAAGLAIAAGGALLAAGDRRKKTR